MLRPIDGADYFVRVVPFPVGCGCDGCVTPNDDGTYSIYIDARTTAERQIIAFDHELLHITNDDFSNGRDISEVERI